MSASSRSRLAFPRHRRPDFDFVRQLIEQDLVPDDVTIQVLTQAREPLIARSFEALKGAKRAIMHLYNSTSTVQREQVFKMSRDEIKEIAVQGASWIRDSRHSNPRPIGSSSTRRKASPTPNSTTPSKSAMRSSAYGNR